MASGRLWRAAFATTRRRGHPMARDSVQRSAAEAYDTLAARLLETRKLSRELAEPLSPEDMTVQAMDDASPTKWHLAHVTWFFETFILAKHLPGYRVFDDTFNYCFNSYYESQGPRQPRPRRGVLTRPVGRARAGLSRARRRGAGRAVPAGRRGPGRDRPAGRGRHQPRAAAPGAPAHRYPGAVRRQPAAARLSSSPAARRPDRRTGERRARLDRLSRRHPPGRP